MSDAADGAWLSLDEAAGRLGASRLRLREAIAAGAIPARRDNRGFWRVSLSDDIEAAKLRLRGARVAPQALVELLFDEIEEMNALLAERNGDIERMSRLVVRQQDLLERALLLTELPASGETSIDPERIVRLNERSQALIEQTLSKLETRDAEMAKMTGLMDRALTTVERLDAEVARQNDVARKQQALLDRVFALAHTSLERISGSRSGSGFLGRLRKRIGGARANSR